MNETSQRVRALIARELSIDVDRVIDAAKLQNDLGADHIDIVSLAMELEDAFGIRLTDDQVESMTHVASVIALVAPADQAEAA